METTLAKELGKGHLLNSIPSHFTGSTKAFFEFIYCDKEDAKWYSDEIKSTLEQYKEPAEQIYRIAETIRIHVVEGFLPEVKELYAPYSNILTAAIYDCDCYAIAKELLKQYNASQEDTI